MWEDAWFKDELVINLKYYKHGVEWALKHQGSIIDNYFKEDTNSWNICRPSRERIANQLK